MSNAVAPAILSKKQKNLALQSTSLFPITKNKAKSKRPKFIALLELQPLLRSAPLKMSGYYRIFLMYDLGPTAFYILTLKNLIHGLICNKSGDVVEIVGENHIPYIETS